MDIKSSLENYCKATGVAVDLPMVKASIEAIKAAGVEYEFRTTALKSILSEEDMEAILRLIGPDQPYNVRRGNLKNKVLDNTFADRPDYTDEEWERIRSYGGKP